jgi:hypothetical protein
MYETLFFSALLHLLSEEEEHKSGSHACLHHDGAEIHANSIQIFSASQIEIYIPHIYTHHHREREGGETDTYVQVHLAFFFPSAAYFVSYPQLYCKEISIYVLPEKELRGLSPHFHIHVSVSDLQYIFPRSVHLFYCSRIGRPIIEVFNSFSTGNRSFFLIGTVGTVFRTVFLFIFPLQMSSLSLSQLHHQHEVFTPGKYRSVHSFTQSCGSAFSIFKKSGTPARIPEKWEIVFDFYIIIIHSHQW